MRKFLDRLFPTRLRQRTELTPDQRLAIWAHTADQDNALRAVQDLLEDALEGNCSVAFNPDEPEAKRLLACNRAGIVCDLMRQIETERARAKQLATPPT